MLTDITRNKTTARKWMVYNIDSRREWVLSDLRTPPTTSSLLPPAPSSKHLQTFVLMRRKHKRGYKKKGYIKWTLQNNGQWEVLNHHITNCCLLSAHQPFRPTYHDKTQYPFMTKTLPLHDQDTLIFFMTNTR